MAMQLSFRYRIYPSRKQIARLNKTLSDCCFVYNKLLEKKIDAYKHGKKSITKYDMDKIVKELDVSVYSQVLQNITKRIDEAYKHFFRRIKEKRKGRKIKVGFPRFKTFRRYKSITYPQFGFKFISDKRLHVSKIGNIPLILHRVPKGKIKTMTIKKTAKGWFAILSCEDVPIEHIESKNGHVGIDVGIESFAMLSDGAKIENPKFLIHSEEKLAKYQRRLSRKKKGSNNRKKAGFRVAKLHCRIASQRLDFLHKASISIVKNYKMISVEELKIQNMVKNHYLAKSISDAGWGNFIQMLGYKVEKTGGRVIKVDPRNTSKTCSKCGHMQDMPLSKRTFECQECGFVCDRDLNSALNISRAGRARIHACGNRVRPSEMKATIGEAGTICELA